MLSLDDIRVEFECQGFKGTHLGISPKKDKTVMFLESVRSTKSVRCPFCGGEVYIYENGQVKLKDIPLWKGTEHICNFSIHRYKCNCCHETFTEEIPFKYPGTRITHRAANWIKGFLQQKVSIKAIQELTGIHWDTIRKVQREIMDQAIQERENELKREGYKPRILAVDEFAIHKGHSYATCVMDLEQGDNIGFLIVEFQVTNSSVDIVTDSPTLSISAEYGNVNETVEAKVIIENNPSITALRISVAYSSDNLELLEINNGGEF